MSDEYERLPIARLAGSFPGGTLYIDILDRDGEEGRIRFENAEGVIAPVVINRGDAKHIISSIANAFGIDLGES